MMSTNRVGNIRRDTKYSQQKQESKNKLTWKELVEKEIKDDELAGATCQVYSTSDKDIDNEAHKCLCGRAYRRHSFEGDAQRQYGNESSFKKKRFLTQTNQSIAYGQLRTGTRVC